MTRVLENYVITNTVLMAVLFLDLWNFGNSLQCPHGKKVFRNLTSGIIFTLSDNSTHKYEPNQRCEWLIVNPNHARYPFISLNFIQKDTECSFDYIMVFNGDGYNKELLATHSGLSKDLSLPQLYANSSQMLVYFFSDHNFQLKGFSARFHVFACPNNCSNQGRCLNNRCDCNHHWSGEDCSKPICPYSCSYGFCDYQSTKQCICKSEFLGIGCRMPVHISKHPPSFPNFWTLVFNYTDAENITTSLAGHGGAYAGGYFYVFGGYNLNKAFNELLRYNFTVNRWSLVKPSSSTRPLPRYYHTVSHLNDGLANDYLLVFGGTIEVDNLSDELWIHDNTLLTWSLIDNNLKGTLLPTSHHAAAVVHNNEGKHLYIFGGISTSRSQMTLSPDLFRFSWEKRLWEKVEVDPGSFKPTMLRRAGHSMVYDEVADGLFVFGGYAHVNKRSVERTNSLYLFDLKRKYWLLVTAPNPPQSRAFHTANVIGDHMIVFGGSVHVHEVDETCHSDHLYFYNLRCNTWEKIEKSLGSKPTGRFSHVAVVKDSLLFIHGGYNGMVLNQLYAYRVPWFAMNNLKGPVSLLCDKYRNSFSCSHDVRCVWNRKCMALFNVSSAVLTTSFRSRCPGFCRTLGTCWSCTLLHSYQLNDTYQWEKVPCGWCASTFSCRTLDFPGKKVCGEVNKATLERLWDGPYTMTSQCLSENVPPGALAAFYYNNPNLTSPDEVILIKDNFDLRDVNSSPPPGNHTVVIQGFLHIPPRNQLPNLRLGFVFTCVHGYGKFYLEKDNASQMIMQNTDGINNPSVKILNASSIVGKRLYFKVVFHYTPQLFDSYVILQWTVGRNYRRNPVRISSDYLEPYQSPHNQDICPSYRGCLSCLTDFTCTWCVGLQRCVSRQDVLTSYRPLCLPPSYSSYPGDRFTGVIINTSDCPSCFDHYTCESCVNNSDLCGWNATKFGLDNKCLKLNYFTPDSAKSDSRKCPLPCQARTSCSECLAGGDEICRWCKNTMRCFDMKHKRLIYSFGQCFDWISKADFCTNCSRHVTCRDCVQTFQCGWCSGNPFQGLCVDGDFSGVANGQTCSDFTFNNEVLYNWSYAICNIDECTMEWPEGTSLHNCSPNATCVDTYTSFECRCLPGFTGDGVQCNRTCLQKCSHGKCGDGPDYKCQCDIGWFGTETSTTNCNIDCGCNFHSRCDTGIGVCDRCHNNTMGEHCEKCLPRHYGNPLKEGEICWPCSCNGHGDPNRGLCNSSTGQCYCLHHTSGENCESCSRGFYGDPRNGSYCYRACAGRIYYPSSEKTGAFGSWSSSSHQPGYSSEYCLCVIAAEDSNTIQLTLDRLIDVNCLSDRVLVYDGIVSSTDANILASICGSSSHADINLYAKSGFLSVLYQTNRRNGDSRGFNATFRVYRDNSARSVSLCPNNCSKVLNQGECFHGVCRCRRGYSGRDCSLSVFSITSSAYWESEVDVDWLSGNNHVGDLPGGLFGHSLLSEGTNLWMFGGFSYKNVSSDLWRYDVTHKKWTKESPPTGSLPSPRYLHASAMLPDYNKMLLFGGMSKERETLNDFWEFNFARENINAVEGCVQRYTDASLPHVAAHTLTLYSSSIAVLIGGFSSDQKFNRQVWAYNASCNHWFHLVSSGVPFPGVYGHTSVYDNHTDKIYVYGGIHNYVSTVGKIDVTRIIYAYSLSYRKWSIMTFAKQSRTSPPPRYFHSVLPFVEGKRRGFLVLGGKRDHNTFLSDVWLFLYDCRIWIKLSADNLGSSEMSSPLVGAASAAAALSRIDSQPTSSYYVYGGSHNGVLLHTLQVFRVLSFCNAAITASDCEFLSPDCKWRPSKTSENERCVSTHSLVSDDVSWRSDAFVQNRNKSSCDSCEQMLEEDLKLVSFPRMNGACRAQECSQSMTCTECVLFLPKSNHSYCKWCTDERGTNKPFEGHCLPEDTSCPVKTDCESTICDACNELDCTACMKSTGCVWRGFSGQGICSSDYNLTSNFPKPNLINPAVPMAASKRSFSATCSKECSNYLSCDSCLKEDLPCSWSFDLALCISSTYSELLCLNGLCGQVVHSSVSECARVQCDNITYCRDCTRSPSCGWIGCEDGDGRGRCTKGTFKGPDDVNLLASYQKWYYTSCPQENECYNNHHTCSVDLHESCEDELDGFTCVCRENYVRKGRLCVPICYPACEKGVCVSPDKCRCDFGITGDLCNETCNCYGNGQCSSANLNQCEDCRNNSKGNQCEHCKVGYVGNPAKNEPCRTCLSVCNYRSDNCSSEENVYGPKSTNATICHNCLNHSEGQHCQDCIDGYYERDGSCQKCDCNNHTIYCDKQNGRCACLHNTMTVVCNANTPTSSTSPCVSGQCNMCASRFIGNPSNGGPCYEEKEEGNALCFSSLSESKCPCADCSNIHLASNQRNFFAFRPRFVDVDFRLHLDVTEGEVDIYIANSLKLFDFRIYPHHLVKRSHSNPTDEDANLLQRKIRFSSEATKEIKDNPYGDKTTRIRLIEAGNLTDYVTLDPNQPVHVRGVRNRLLLIGRHQLFNLSNTYIYVVLVAPHPQAEPVTSSGDGVKSGRSRRAVDDAQLSTRGRLVLKQNQTVLNLFVFFSSFLSCFFIFLSLGIVVWKVKQKVEMRQALIAHYMKLQQMANRPFATVNLHFDSNFDREKSRHSAFCENLLELKEIPSSRSSEPARTKSTIFIRRNRKSIAPMVSLAEPIRNNSVIEAFASSTSSPGKKSQPELSHLQSTSSELGVHDGGDGVGRQVSGQSSSVLDPQIPLLHTPSSFLTTTADGDGNPRLTPEPPPLDCPFSFTTSSPSTSLHRGTNSGFFSNSERHNPSRVAAINRTVSTPVLRNATFGALTPRSNHCPVPSGRVCRPPAASCALFKRSNSERKVCKKSDVEAVPVAFQLTRDAQAGIATVVLQLPGGKNIPCSLCLGSALVSAKHLSMVSLLDLKKSKIRSKFVTSKGL